MPPDTQTSTNLAGAEFEALRATIRERGTLRTIVTTVTFLVWALIAAGAAAIAPRPGVALVALVVLASGFEVVRTLHLSVERIGRYLQIRYEHGPDGPRWETTAMRLGQRPDASLSIDALGIRLFAVAGLVNLLVPIVTNVTDFRRLWPAWLAVAALHAGFGLQLARSRRFAAGQRQRDLDLLRHAVDRDQSG